MDACLPSKRSVYETPGGKLRFGKYSCGFEYVVEGSSVTAVPSDRAADHRNTYPSSFVHAESINSELQRRVSRPRGTAPFTTVDAAMYTPMLHNAQVVPSPEKPSGQAPHA